VLLVSARPSTIEPSAPSIDAMTAFTTATPRFRTATAGDLAAVERLLVDAGLPTAGVADIFAERAADFVVADDPRAAGELAAVAGLETCCENALLRSVAVRPEWRASGLGRELVRRVVCLAEARGLGALYLLTMTAEHYFPRFGFTAVARDDVPADVRDSLEFRSACPASAVAMVKPLAG
jgi:amino-acid N-acetyltransferase